MIVAMSEDSQFIERDELRRKFAGEVRRRSSLKGDRRRKSNATPMISVAFSPPRMMVAESALPMPAPQLPSRDMIRVSEAKWRALAPFNTLEWRQLTRN